MWEAVILDPFQTQTTLVRDALREHLRTLRQNPNHVTNVPMTLIVVMEQWYVPFAVRVSALWKRDPLQCLTALVCCSLCFN